jgi:hypothetical protein
MFLGIAEAPFPLPIARGKNVFRLNPLAAIRVLCALHLAPVHKRQRRFTLYCSPMEVLSWSQKRLAASSCLPG